MYMSASNDPQVGFCQAHKEQDFNLIFPMGCVLWLDNVRSSILVLVQVMVGFPPLGKEYFFNFSNWDLHPTGPEEIILPEGGKSSHDLLCTLFTYSEYTEY